VGDQVYLTQQVFVVISW